MSKITSILALWAATSIAAGAAPPVINYRNGGTGAYPNADPPLEWSVTKNVKWRWDAPMFGTSISSPIIVGDRVITLARPMRLVCLDKHTGRELWMREAYLDKDSDEVVRRMHAAIGKDHRLYELNCRLGRGGGGSWRNNARGYRRIFEGRRGLRDGISEEEAAFYRKRVAMFEGALADGEANKEAYSVERKALIQDAARSDTGFFGEKGYQAASTPASDGKRIVAVFKPGLVVCVDLAGELLWTRAVVNDQGRAPRYRWSTLAEVPQIADGKVLVTCSNLTRCFDVKTGRLIWSDDNGSTIDAASAVIGRAGSRHYVFMPSGQVRALKDGRVVYERPDYPPDSLLGADIYAQRAISADRRTFSNVSVALHLTGNPGQPVERLWTLDEAYSLDKKEKKDRRIARRGVVRHSHHEYSAPLIHDGRLYYKCTGGRPFSVLDLKSGKVLRIVEGDAGEHSDLWSYSDPIMAGRYFFYPIGCTHGQYDGRTLVFKLGPDLAYQEVAFNRLEQQTACTPVFEGRRMYMRTNYALFCIEKPGSAK